MKFGINRFIPLRIKCNNKIGNFIQLHVQHDPTDKTFISDFKCFDSYKMEFWGSLPIELGQGILSNWLELKDVVNFDTACCIRDGRNALMYHIHGMIITREMNLNSDALCNWLYYRKAGLLYINIIFDQHGSIVPSSECLKNVFQYCVATTKTIRLTSEREDDLGIYDLELPLIFKLIGMYCIKIEFLQVRGFAFSDTTLRAGSKIYPRLRKLELINCNIEEGTKGFRLVLSRCINLQVLYCRFAEFDYYALKSTITHCPLLNDIILSQPSLSKPPIESLYTSLFQQCKHLTRIEIDTLDESSITTISGCLPALQSLSVCDASSITDTTLNLLLSSCRSLHELKLCNALSLTTSSMSNIMNMSVLALERNVRVDNNLLLQLIRKNIQLKELYIQTCPITDSCVCPILHLCPHLTRLSMSNTKSKGLAGTNRVLAQVLREQYPCLQEIDIHLT